jgi:predicted MFS family arabinose efflux permease
VQAGLGAYRQLLSDRAARAFSLAGVVARLPLSMTGIGVVLLVSLTTGSFGRAGLITAAGTLTGAVAAPLWGRAIDRVGQATVLLLAATINSASMAVLITSVLRQWPLGVSMAAASGVGLGFSSAGACVRARWSNRLAGSALLSTAFAIEAMLDEVVFVVGPVLVTALATNLSPAAGVITSAVLGLIGAIALAAQRRTEPPVQRDHRQSGPRPRIPVGVVVSMGMAYVALGLVFGGMEVVIVAFAKARGVLPYAGAILMAWAAGSLIAGLITGTIHWKSAPQTRFRVGAACLAGSLLPLPFLTQPVLAAAVLLVSGLAIAPTLIASVEVTQSAVPLTRFTEALGWNSTGLAAGLAAGAAVAGRLVDAEGYPAGFVAVAAAGVLLVLAALTVRRPRAGEPLLAAGQTEPGLSPDPPGTTAAQPSRPARETPLP